MAGVLRVPRSRGALSGVVLVVLGAWGALIPFIGPYFQFAYTPGTVWVYTPARLWLEVVPGVATAVGGLILLSSANRALAAFGAWLAALAGAWFVLGPTVSRLWASSGVPQIGSPLGGPLRRMVVEISYFAGLGVVIVFFAALALGRLAVVATRDAELAAATASSGAGVIPARNAELAAAASGRADAAHPGREPAMLRGFKNFLMQGDLIIIAVGLVVALAFTALIRPLLTTSSLRWSTRPVAARPGRVSAGPSTGSGSTWAHSSGRSFISLFSWPSFTSCSWFPTGPTCGGGARPCSASRNPPRPARNARHPICPSPPPGASTAPPSSPPSPNG